MADGGGQGPSKGLIILFFIFGVGVHFIDGLVYGFDRSNPAVATATLTYYLFLGILYTYLRVGGSDRRTLIKSMVINAFVSFCLWALPMLILTALKFAPAEMKLQFATKIFAVLLLTPVWLWLASDLYAQIPALQFLWTIYLLIWVGVFVFSAFFTVQGKLTEIVQPMKAPVNQAISLIIKMIKDLWNNIVTSSSLALQAVGSAYNQQISNAVGDEYYTGTVEDNEDGPIGVSFTGVRMTEDTVFEGDEVSAWVDITARTLDEPITIKVNCYAIDDDGRNFQGDMSPGSGGLTETIYVDSFSEEFLICKFGRTQLDPGSYMMVVNATFNFETWAYLRTYLMDMERLKGDMKLLQDKGTMGTKESILTDIYKISDPTPSARYTNGPVQVGIATNSPPIGVESGGTKALFGVTLDNAWQGKIKHVNSLVLETPSGVSIDTSECDHPTSSQGSSGSFNRYIVSGTGGQIDFYKSFRCRMDISRSALDQAPVTIRNLKVTAKYDYVIEEYAYFDVEEHDFGGVI